MQPLLVATKFVVPSLHPKNIGRPRLLTRLDEGMRGKLILVSSQAGSGKTTLIAEWIHTRGLRSAWITLDEGDNDLVRFWACFAKALQSISQKITPELLGMFQFQLSGQGDDRHSAGMHQMEAVLAGFVNSISAEPGEEHALLVLDDLHLITAEPIYHALSYLIDQLPGKFHLVILTRVDPPLQLARLRARQQLTEIHASDLRFSITEIAEFLTQRINLHLPESVLASLEDRTEGWAVGLQMAALAIQRLLNKPDTSRANSVQDIADFVQTFAGSHRFILDYLLEEVLNREPEWLQSFLVQTSILQRMCGSLCDAVTGRSDSQMVLERLEMAHLFIVTLDEDRTWYRYHHLFADLLFKQLRTREPGILTSLHQRASVWYADQNLMPEAIQHAFAAEDFEQAAVLIEKEALAALARNEISTVMNWLARLPEEILPARPWLCVLQAWLLIIIGHGEEIESSLQRAEIALQTWQPGNPETVRLKGYIDAIRAQVAFIRGAAAQAIELGQAAEAKLTSRDVIMSATTAAILGAGYVFLGHFSPAKDAFRKAKTISQNSGNLFNVLLAEYALAQIAVIEGKLGLAHEIYRESIGRTEAVSPSTRPPVLGYVFVGLANILREWNDLEAALEYATEGVRLCKLLGQADILLSAYQILSQVYQSRGEIQQAAEAVHEGLRAASELSAWSVSSLLTQQVRMWLSAGEIEAAENWVQQCGLQPNDTVRFYQQASYLCLARVLISKGQSEIAASLLDRLFQSAETAGQVGILIEISLLQAVNFWRNAETTLALEALRRALSLAEPQGYLRIFLDEGQPVLAMLEQARPCSSGLGRRYIDKLMEAFRPGDWKASQIENSLAEPLSERELDVLQLLALGRSNLQIAGQLYISLNTVKAHLKSIYGKLNAHNRTEAIQQARDLELL